MTPVPPPLIAFQVVTSFEAGAARSLTLVVLVGAMAYAVAFAETLSISGFPYYEFEDRDMAYVFGSAFYGIYFIVRLDHVQFIRWLAPASTLLTLIARLYV